MYEQLAHNVFPAFDVGLLHGRLANDEKEDMMQRFKRGEVQSWWLRRWWKWAWMCPMRRLC